MSLAKWDKIAIVLAVLGLLISIYLTYTHYADVPVACPTSGVLNCADVLNSPYSMLFGVPLSLLGVLYFAAYLAMLFFRRNREYLLIFSAVGMGFVFYFWYLEYLLAHICEYCTAVHIITIALLAIAIRQYRKSE